MANISSGFTEIDGEIILDGQNFSLKVDKNRKIYVKNNLSQNPVFNYINVDIPLNMNSEMKKAYLAAHYKKIESDWQAKQNEKISEAEPK
jgi:hypothetical protein